MQKTVIVVPCFNEARRLLPDAFLEAVSTDPLLAFLFVDDGSVDETPDQLERMRADRPEQIAVLTLDRNRGKAYALRQGVLAAFAQSPSLVGYFDADLATPLSELAPMRAFFDNPDVHLVLGSRVALLGRDVRRSPIRHYLGRVFATVASLALELQVYDTQCGAKLLRNTAAIRGIFEEEFSVTWSFDVEILARARSLAQKGLLPPLAKSAVEYPLCQWHDVSGSKLGVTDSVRAAAELIGLWMRYHHERPNG
jgi:dolichyl-phosphate beta-glucosyltransferase